MQELFTIEGAPLEPNPHKIVGGQIMRSCITDLANLETLRWLKSDRAKRMFTENRQWTMSPLRGLKTSLAAFDLRTLAFNKFWNDNRFHLVIRIR